MSARHTRPLRVALLANALLSCSTGLALSTSSAQIAPWLGAVSPSALLALGLALLGFAGLIAVVIARPRPVRALAISAADLVWVLATTPLLFVPGLLTEPGKVAVAAVAALVGTVGIAQILGIRTMLRDAIPGRGRYRHCLRVRVDAPASAMWETIADFGKIERYSPTLASSILRDGARPGPGTVRECSNPRGDVWAEECEVFDAERRRLEFRFRVEEEGFPFPVQTMFGGWNVTEADEGCVVEVWWSLTPSARPGWLMVILLGLQVDRDLRGPIGRMAEVARGNPVPFTAPKVRLAWC